MIAHERAVEHREYGAPAEHGELTVRGATRPLAVRVDAARMDGPRLRLRASSRIDRYEFRITAMKGMTGRRLTVRLDITSDRT